MSHGDECAVCGGAPSSVESLGHDYYEALRERDMAYWVPDGDAHIAVCEECFYEHLHVIDAFSRPPSPTDDEVSEFLDALDPDDIMYGGGGHGTPEWEDA